MPVPAYGGAALRTVPRLVIRFSRQGCTNRPFYHLHVSDKMVEPWEQCIEQLGSFDPLPNERNEKLVSLNFERIRYWMGEGAYFSHEARVVLGLVGFLPIHPSSYVNAWRRRIEAEQPEPPMPKTLTWRERKKILMQQAEERLKSPVQSEELEDKTESNL